MLIFPYQVEPRSALPLYCIGLSTAISLLLALINIGSATAFNALTSLVIASSYTSYAIAASIFLIEKFRPKEERIPSGPFQLGRAGIPIIIASIIYSIIGVFFSFWPGVLNPSLLTMNWSVVVFFGVLILSMGFWLIHGRKVYTGPIFELSPSEAARYRQAHLE